MKKKKPQVGIRLMRKKKGVKAKTKIEKAHISKCPIKSIKLNSSKSHHKKNPKKETKRASNKINANDLLQIAFKGTNPNLRPSPSQLPQPPNLRNTAHENIVAFWSATEDMDKETELG